MKIQYWGTAAAEGIPAVFCRCEVCKFARKNKGPEIRTRSQALIDDRLLIDFGPDTYTNALKYNCDLSYIEHCLITHAHEDHLHRTDICTRNKNMAILPDDLPPLTVYGGAGVEKALSPDETGQVTKDGRVVFKKVSAFQKHRIGEYTVIPLPAQHATEDPLVYIIQNEEKCLLYGNDTDVFDERTWAYLEKSNLLFNVVSLDCTEGIRHIDYRGHMNFERDLIVKERMRRIGVISDSTIFVATHFSHNGKATQQVAQEYGKDYGFVAAYDGMTINF